MKKLSIAILIALTVSGCSNVTGLTVHKNDVHALIEKNNNEKCVVQFHDSTGIHKDIEANFSCNNVKYFDDNK